MFHQCNSVKTQWSSPVQWWIDSFFSSDETAAVELWDVKPLLTKTRAKKEHARYCYMYFKLHHFGLQIYSTTEIQTASVSTTV